MATFTIIIDAYAAYRRVHSGPLIWNPQRKLLFTSLHRNSLIVRRSLGANVLLNQLNCAHLLDCIKKWNENQFQMTRPIFSRIEWKQGKLSTAIRWLAISIIITNRFNLELRSIQIRQSTKCRKKKISIEPTIKKTYVNWAFYVSCTNIYDVSHWQNWYNQNRQTHEKNNSQKHFYSTETVWKSLTRHCLRRPNWLQSADLWMLLGKKWSALRVKFFEAFLTEK